MYLKKNTSDTDEMKLSLERDDAIDLPRNATLSFAVADV